MKQLSISIETFFWNLVNRIQIKDLVDILIIAFLMYRIFRLTHQTRAGQVFKGYLLLILISCFPAIWASRRSTGWLAAYSTTVRLYC